MPFQVRIMGRLFFYNEDNKRRQPQTGWLSGKKGIPMEVEIRHVRGHVEVYSEAGEFLFSADTVYEARMELLEEAA